MSPRADLQAIGSTGLAMYGGRVYEEYLPELSIERGRRVFREMSEQDPVIAGLLFAVEMLIRQVTWTTVPSDSSTKAQKVAEFVDGCFDDMSPTHPDTISEILSMLKFGWSYFELVYKMRHGFNDDPKLHSKFDDGKIGWARWGVRGQETLLRWEVDDNGDILGLHQLAPPKFIPTFIPLAKALHFRTKAKKGNPEGESILRAAYRPWYFKKHIETIEGIGVERDLAGLPVMYVPANILSSEASDTDKALLEVLKKIVTNIRRDEEEGVLMPNEFDANGHPLYELKLLSSGGTRQFDTDKIISRYDQRIAMTVMADFILLGHENVGSFALSSDKTELFSLALGAWLDSIAAEINSRAIPKLLDVNGIPLDLSPTRKHGDVETQNLGELGKYLSDLAGAGMAVFPNAALEKYMLEQAGLPVPTEPIEVIPPTEQPPTPPPAPPTPPPPTPTPPVPVPPDTSPSHPPVPAPATT